MKAIYKILSGLLLSVIATLAMAALVSLSALTKPETNNLKAIGSNEPARTICSTKHAYNHHKPFHDHDGRYTAPERQPDCY